MAKSKEWMRKFAFNLAMENVNYRRQENRQAVDMYGIGSEPYSEESIRYWEDQAYLNLPSSSELKKAIQEAKERLLEK